jgi:hypothetical protein
MRRSVLGVAGRMAGLDTLRLKKSAARRQPPAG